MGGLVNVCFVYIRVTGHLEKTLNINIMKQISILFLFFCVSIYSQVVKVDSSRVNANVRMVENLVKRDSIVKILRCQKENIFNSNILDEKITLIYSEEVFKKKNPRVNLKKQKHYIAAQEDSSKKLWIVIIDFPGELDGLFGYIFSKNDGQLIYYGNHWHG